MLSNGIPLHQKQVFSDSSMSNADMHRPLAKTIKRNDSQKKKEKEYKQNGLAPFSLILIRIINTKKNKSCLGE